MKHKVVLYQETYTTVEIEAENQLDANVKVSIGEYRKKDIVDVTVKESEVLEFPLDILG